MLRLSRPRKARENESTIALINIVFLMLIFFLIAGTLTPPLDPEVSLIATQSADKSEPPDALFATREGTLRIAGEQTTAVAFVASLREAFGNSQPDTLEIKLAADRALPATDLIGIVGELKAAGAGKVSIITERSAQ